MIFPERPHFHWDPDHKGGKACSRLTCSSVMHKQKSHCGLKYTGLVRFFGSSHLRGERGAELQVFSSIPHVVSPSLLLSFVKAIDPRLLPSDPLLQLILKKN